ERLDDGSEIALGETKLVIRLEIKPTSRSATTKSHTRSLPAPHVEQVDQAVKPVQKEDTGSASPPVPPPPVQANASTAAVPLVPPPPAEFEAISTASPPVPLPPGASEPIKMRVSETAASVKPGSSAPLTVTVENLTDRVVDIAVTLEGQGITREWYT